jgi:alpha-glucosidase
MRNMSQSQFYPRDLPNTVPFSQGTRAHEMAMYVVFDHWLAYLCDAPTEYKKYPDILDFLANVPSTWDRTLPLDSRLGDYITIAKQSGTDWYVGGMASWAGYDVDVDFSFLNPGKQYTAHILKDGPSAGNYPTRYTADTITVNSQTKMTFNMARGGGFVIRLIEGNNVGIEKPDVKTKTSLSINKDVLSVQSNENIRGITIYTLTGQLMANHEFLKADSQQINLSGWNKGVYVAEIQTESTIDSLKFIY